MKKLIIIFLLLPLLGRAQAHIGMTDSQIRAEHTSVSFKSDETSKGVKYISGDMGLGTFYYYFDNEGYSDFNMQIPYTMKDVNAQTEIYNSKYVILTDHSWKAYVNDGGILFITLEYDKDNKIWIFYYSN